VGKRKLGGSEVEVAPPGGRRRRRSEALSSLSF
jgi:hypothetical protein